MQLGFHGGAGTVTGSRTLVTHGGRALLVDCGLFQGYKNLRLMNWAPFPFDPASLDCVILTHAHLDHSGALPLLMKPAPHAPSCVYLTHGEPGPADALRQRIERELGWDAYAPRLGQTIDVES